MTATSLLLSLLLVQAAPSGAASAADPKPDRIDFGLLPLVNFDSDLGLGLGLNVGVYVRGEGFSPYRYSLSAQGFFTTGGVQNHYLYFDAPNFLRSGLRPSFEVAVSRDLARPFYGVGNDVRYPGDAADPERYFHQLDSVSGTAAVERALGGGWELVGSYALGRFSVGAPPGSLLAADAPAGIEGGWVGKGAVDLSIDTRDNEPSPTSGVLAGVALRGGHLGVSSAFGGATLHGRVYLAPFGSPWLVIAARAVIDALAGDVPFFELDSFGGRGAVPLTGLGGARSVRGVPRLLYIGEVKALVNLELRSRVARFTPGDHTLDLWLVGFGDGGRVWAEPGTPDSGAIHVSGGGGVRLAWEQDYVVRVDYGLSALGESGLYIGFDQTF